MSTRHACEMCGAATTTMCSACRVPLCRRTECRLDPAHPCAPTHVVGFSLNDLEIENVTRRSVDPDEGKMTMENGARGVLVYHRPGGEKKIYRELLWPFENRLYDAKPSIEDILLTGVEVFALPASVVFSPSTIPRVLPPSLATRTKQKIRSASVNLLQPFAYTDRDGRVRPAVLMISPEIHEGGGTFGHEYQTALSLLARQKIRDKIVQKAKDMCRKKHGCV